MSRLSLTFACCRYDRMEAIREGAFPIEGIDLNCITLRSGREVFGRMVGGQEFDVAERSASARDAAPVSTCANDSFMQLWRVLLLTCNLRRSLMSAPRRENIPGYSAN